MSKRTHGKWSIEEHGGTFVLYAGRDNEHHGYDLMSLEDVDSNFNANADFIVRACNSHDDLVKACKKVLADCENGTLAELPQQTISMLKAAIKKAEEVEG